MPRSTTGPGWRDPALVVLGCLAAGPRHGYAIMTAAREEYGAALGPGTLYGVLARLEERGLVEPLASEDPRRRPYALTVRGREALAEQVASMRAFSTKVSRRLGAAARPAGTGAL